MIGEHESSGQNLKRGPLDVIVSKETLIAGKCSFRNQRCEKPWLGEKDRLGMLNQTAGQGLIDDSEGCGKIGPQGIMLTQS
jgi:hypothetical protein